MAIPETQLETWSHQGSITNSANTGNSVKTAIESYTGFPEGVKFKVYLQGSYKNDTNVYGDSDVDVVVELTSSFQNNLNDEQDKAIGITKASYSLSDFRNDVDAGLASYYKRTGLSFGNKVVKIPASSNRLDAEVLTCCQYRLYYQLASDKYHSGITFKTRNTNEKVINFPVKHSDNATTKHQATNSWFKPTVRIFKNMRKYMTANSGFNKSLAPSYFIECLIANIPNNQFGRNYQTTVINCHNYLTQNSMDDFMCLNGIRPLWGDSNENWNQVDAKYFLEQIVQLWNNW
ncbi:MAG: nucleotidyltransferase [Bacteroidetes bacterium]|nr:nucleotidyltransferase [Bacteroidota bacterium]